MVDPRATAVFVRKDGGEFAPRKVTGIREDDRYIYLGREDGSSYYRNLRENVCVSSAQQRVTVESTTRVHVEGRAWSHAFEVVSFAAPDRLWSRIFYRRKDGTTQFADRQAALVAILPNAAASRVGAPAMSYWRRVVEAMPQNDPLRFPYAGMDFIDSDSVLGGIFADTGIQRREWNAPLIFPFSCNRSQRLAVEAALQSSLSVIDGPPGTGKTQTILNLIGNIVTFDPEATVGVVSSNNAAVENVGTKLSEAGLDFVVASLGRKDKREPFFARQAQHNGQRRQFLDEPPEPCLTDQQFRALDNRRRKLDETRLQKAQLEAELKAFRLEQRHFLDHLARQQLPELATVPLLRRSSDALVDYLATSALAPDSRLAARITHKIRSYIKYGPLRDIDPDDTHFLLQVEAHFYERRIEEIERNLGKVERRLSRGNYETVAQDHVRASVAQFHRGLRDRYTDRAPTRYDAGYRRSPQRFASFTKDYPVLLSTCHSLRNSIASDYLLDYLVIDEASQLDLPTAALALASCRSAVVVGDLLQLQPVTNADAAKAAGAAPFPCFDYATQSALSAIIELYGDALPRTMLREHYRCDPTIIGFCNTKFYDGRLIPFTDGSDPEPLAIHRTVKGNHQRGRMNVREVEVLTGEVIPPLLADYDIEEIGTTTPYRQQVGTVDEFITAIHEISGMETDTVHKYQGREKDVMIMTTVLSENRNGHMGLRFVDDPHLVNVAVSRAVKKFVLVTNHDMLPRSRNLRDLIDYIAYQNPGQDPRDSEIVSMFDLLYREYSEKLRPLARRLRGEMRYKSEDIVWTRLHEMVAEPRYEGLHVAPQVLLHNTFKDRSGLTAAQNTYVDKRASFDFVVYFRVGNRPAFAVEVDGYHYHRSRLDQERRDALKNAICQIKGLPLLRLPTWHSDEEERLLACLDAAVAGAPIPA